MSKKIEVVTGSGAPGSLTVDGASPDDTGPTGPVVRLMLAVLRGDVAACRQEMVPGPEDSGSPSPPANDIEAKFGQVIYETPERAIVPTEAIAGGQTQNVSFVTARTDKGWKVDMGETMQRMLGPMMDAMREGMETMGQAMGEAMDGIAKGMSEAMGKPNEPDPV